MATLLELLLAESPYGIWSALHMNMEAEAAVRKHRITKMAASVFFLHVRPTCHSDFNLVSYPGSTMKVYIPYFNIDFY